MGVFFTSDNHFGHKNIIEYCQRPFETVEEMDKTMVDNWNMVIEPNDIIYHLGDFTLGGENTARKYFKQLNGQIKMLINVWHHDKHWVKALADKWSDLWIYVKPISALFVIEGKPPIVLCHYPLAIWDRKHYGSWHLHGHSHGKYRDKGFIMDVGVDINHFAPVSLEVVKEYMRNASS